jgi:hypothetical protein
MSSGNLAYCRTRGSNFWSFRYPGELFARTRKGTHEELGLGRGFILFEIGLLLAFRHRDVYDSDVLVESRSIAQRTRAQSSASFVPRRGQKPYRQQAETHFTYPYCSRCRLRTISTVSHDRYGLDDSPDRAHSRKPASIASPARMIDTPQILPWKLTP